MENNVPDQKVPLRTPSSREPLFGALLFGLIVFLIVGFIGGLGWAGYASWKSTKENKNQPSISNLEQQKTEEAKEEVKQPEEPKTESQTPQSASQPDVTKQAKETAVSVQNGGAAKGSAGVLAEALKKEGFTKVTAGNTLADYTGVVVYFTSGLDKEAEIVKSSVMKTYPQVTIKAADATNKETSTSAITVILGK